MKRITSILLAIIMTFGCAISVLAESSDSAFDLSTLTRQELEELDTLIHQELANREEGQNGIITDENIDTMFEGETELSDESFLRDLASGLVERWKIADTDTTMMSDKQTIAHLLQCVNSELVFISKYSDFEFSDSKLGEYAHAYMNALQSQFIGISEYYGIDDDLYETYFVTDGYFARARYIYLINKAYGIDLPSKYNDALRDMLQLGMIINISTPTTTAIENALSAIELSFDTSSSSNFLYVLPFNIENTAPAAIQDLSVVVNFLDDRDVVVDTGHLVSYTSVPKGKTVSTNKVMTDDHFTHVSYSYSFAVQTDFSYDQFEGTVEPSIQYSWDGTVKKNGELTEGQPILEITKLSSGWEMNTSWSKTLYVPVLKFDVLNSGTGDATKVTVKVVFTDQATKQVWDEETTYVIGSSDTPLKAGFSKKAFVYSSVGYKTKITPPDLSADIYINGQLVDTITVNK